MKIAINIITLSNYKYLYKTISTLFNSDIIEDNTVDVFCYVNNIYDNRFNIKEMLEKFDINNNVKYGTLLNDFKKEKHISFRPYYSTFNDGIVNPRIYNMNQILKLDYDYMLEVHDDMIFPRKWFKKMFSAVKYNEKYQIIMPCLIGVDNMDETAEIIEDRAFKQLGDRSKFLTINEFSCQVHPWLVKIDLIKKIGYYDSAFSPSAGEDDDFYFRAIKAGYIPIIVSNSFVGHSNGKVRDVAKLGYSNYDKIFFQKHKLYINEYKNNFLINKEICLEKA